MLGCAMKVRCSLWIGTADIKDLYVLQGCTEKPFLGVLSELLGKGVEVRLIHAVPSMAVSLLKTQDNMAKSRSIIYKCGEW